MTTKEALDELVAMDRQIIHGPTIFADIANVIRKQETVRKAALEALASWLNAEGLCDSLDDLFLCHRILTTGELDGVGKGVTKNMSKSL